MKSILKLKAFKGASQKKGHLWGVRQKLKSTISITKHKEFEARLKELIAIFNDVGKEDRAKLLEIIEQLRQENAALKRYQNRLLQSVSNITSSILYDDFKKSENRIATLKAKLEVTMDFHEITKGKSIDEIDHRDLKAICDNNSNLLRGPCDMFLKVELYDKSDYKLYIEHYKGKPDLRPEILLQLGVSYWLRDKGDLGSRDRDRRKAIIELKKARNQLQDAVNPTDLKVKIQYNLVKIYEELSCFKEAKDELTDLSRNKEQLDNSGKILWQVIETGHVQKETCKTLRSICNSENGNKKENAFALCNNLNHELLMGGCHKDVNYSCRKEGDATDEPNNN